MIETNVANNDIKDAAKKFATDALEGSTTVTRLFDPRSSTEGQIRRGGIEPTVRRTRAQRYPVLDPNDNHI
jgi:hypothetical protein